MNQKSKADYLANYVAMNPWIKRGVALLLLVGIIISVYANTRPYYEDTSSTLYIGMALTMISFFGWIYISMQFNKAVTTAKSVCTRNMKEYVEIELNEQWQKTKNIRWAWNVETITGRKGRISYRYHIEITSMLSQNVQMVQMPIQGQQMVMQQVGGQPVMVQQVGGQPVMVQQVGGQQMVMQQVRQQFSTQQQGAPVQVVYVQNPNQVQVQSQNPPQYQTQAPPQYESEAPPAYDGAGGDAPGTAGYQ